jgi:hypothetical protein
MESCAIDTLVHIFLLCDEKDFINCYNLSHSLKDKIDNTPSLTVKLEECRITILYRNKLDVIVPKYLLCEGNHIALSKGKKMRFCDISFIKPQLEQFIGKVVAVPFDIEREFMLQTELLIDTYRNTPAGCDNYLLCIHKKMYLSYVCSGYCLGMIWDNFDTSTRSTSRTDISDEQCKLIAYKYIQDFIVSTEEPISLIIKNKDFIPNTVFWTKDINIISDKCTVYNTTKEKMFPNPNKKQKLN